MKGSQEFIFIIAFLVNEALDGKSQEQLCNLAASCLATADKNFWPGRVSHQVVKQMPTFAVLEGSFGILQLQIGNDHVETFQAQPFDCLLQVSSHTPEE